MASDINCIDVCIVGGGIGGLSAAISLQGIGCQVQVYERDGNFADRKQGYGLTLTNSIKGPLAQLGVLDDCLAQNCLSKSHYVFSPSGSVLGYYGRAFKSESIPMSEKTHAGSRGNLRIPRQDLREMMVKRLARDTLRWNRKLIDFEEFPSHVKVTFESSRDGSSSLETVHCKLLVGADGVRSAVRRLKDEKARVTASPLHYLGVAVIIGLSTVAHPLLHSRGFYVVDGTHRMFTMPFLDSVAPSDPDASASHQRNDQLEGKPLSMWQLSFALPSEEEAIRLRGMPFAELIAEAQRRTVGWFDPVHDMIAHTATGEVWGTPLYDRDAMPLKRKDQGSRVTVLGDACHPMSMFKGQGANQALEDGPLLAQWLRSEMGGKKGKRKLGDADSSVKSDSGEARESQGNILSDESVKSEVLFTRLRCFEREMVARSAPKAAGSRQAAQHYHSPAALAESYGMEGVAQEALEREGVIGRLAQEGVDARLGGALDEGVKEALQRYNVLNTE